MKLNERSENEKNNENPKKKEKVTIEDLQEQVLKFEEATGKEFSKYFKQYYPKLVYYIQNICRDEDLAQDLAIESFISSLEKIDSYESNRAQYSTWLFTIARNITLQEVKNSNRFVSMDTSIDEGGLNIKYLISDKSEEEFRVADSIKISDEKARVTLSNIQKLRQPYRKIVEMRELERMSYKDIATKLGSDVLFEVSSHTHQIIELPSELSYMIEIIDSVSGDTVTNFRLIEGDVKRTPFYTHIELPSGSYLIEGREPQNLSTLKSQIRNGRILLERLVRKDFKKIIDLYS